MQEHQKQVSLALDEMKVSEGLVYSHSNGDIIGFTSLGTIGDKMAAFTRKCVNKMREPQVATYVLVLMAWQGPFVHHAESP